ncbi:MAG: hypothetical protein RRY29_06930 [Desulfovibrionaceae bacterium]
MSDVARKVFPMENVLALVVGKEDADIKELVGYLAGRSIGCCCCAKALAPMATGWLASLYPAFINMEWDATTPWDDFVAKTKTAAGDSVSVPPMTPVLQARVAKVLDAIADVQATLEAQKAEIATLTARVEELEPFEGKASDLEKKCTQLEAKVKTMTTDMGGLRKELVPFQGKIAVDQQGLEAIIKDAIKSNMKGLVVGGVAGAVAGAAAAEAAPEEAANDGGPAADFGFGASGSDGDGFGF